MVNRPEIPHLFENDLRRSLSASRPRLLAIDPWVASSPLWAIISSERNVIYMQAFSNELTPGFTPWTISTLAQTSRQEQGSRPLAASRMIQSNVQSGSAQSLCAPLEVFQVPKR